MSRQQGKLIVRWADNQISSWQYAETSRSSAKQIISIIIISIASIAMTVINGLSVIEASDSEPWSSDAPIHRNINGWNLSYFTHVVGTSQYNYHFECKIIDKFKLGFSQVAGASSGAPFSPLWGLGTLKIRFFTSKSFGLRYLVSQSIWWVLGLLIGHK